MSGAIDLDVENSMFSQISAVLQSLTLGDYLSDIPHDAGAVVAYSIIGIFVAFVWMGSRTKKAPRQTFHDS